MVSSIRGETEISVGGEMLPLRFPFSAVVWLEGKFEAKDVNDVVNGTRFASVRDLQVVYEAGRRGAEGPKYRAIQALEEFDKIDMKFADLSNAMFMAVCDSLSLLTGDDEKDDTKKKGPLTPGASPPGTGTTS